MHVPIFDLRVTDTKLKEELKEAFSRVLDHGRLFLGPEVEELEAKAADYIGARFAVGVGSGSSALYLALKASGIGPDDEVITTPLTWVISSNAIKACGATPVFVDVCDDFNIDPLLIGEKITSKTRAILPVHYAGHMCNMEAICDLAEKNNLIVIEDAAQAFGASLNGEKAANFSLAAGVSMNPMKVLGGYGESGAVFTSDENVYRRLKMLRHAGTTSDPKKIITNDCRLISLNHKMDTIKAALLLVSLKHLPERMRTRDQIAGHYDRELPDSIQKQDTAPGEIHARYVYPIRSKFRDRLQVHLEKGGVETKIMHEPLVCDAPVYKEQREDVPNARKVLGESLIIPAHEKLSTEQVKYVVKLIDSF